MWPIQGCAAEQGMVFDLSVLKRVYNFEQVPPKEGVYFRIFFVLNGVRVSNHQRFTYGNGFMITVTNIEIFSDH